ncbi:SsgA family sporulation/cell division regulator [Streptomyces sp. NPDC090112]|uniref:SsgA family sporulation/cell division regulator n=1 Tax=Streptomyces sp. NPDC090112 TaxID=3365949 RepID=UPI0037F21CA2
METTSHSSAARPDACWTTVARQYLPHERMPLTTPVTFSYRRRDPLCIRAVFHCPHDNDVVWDLGRDMLAGATRTLTGGSDVLAWPEASGDRLWLRLGPADADQALLSIDRILLSAWIETTYLLVPPGTEEDHLDWTPLHRLLTPHD